MFWSGNYIAVREVNSLLKEKNVTLTQILEADDILQECKADKKPLIQFLTSPEVLAELITLITEEPPKDVEVQSQYQHASMACEVLTSHVSSLSDRLSSDCVQMNRLCDFINKEPPLNPLLASFFSKTVEMLLERSPKQDCYLYHIVCLRALDFLRARQDFLPNLLRHMATSAVMDTFKHFMRLDYAFDKVILAWMEEHQFLESLIQIVCGSYGHEPSVKEARAPPHGVDCAGSGGEEGVARGADSEGEGEVERVRVARAEAVAAANAASLLCEIIVSGCADDTGATRGNVGATLAARLKSSEGVALLLSSMFTSPAHFRRHAIVNGCQVLLALLHDEAADAREGQQPLAPAERGAVELAVAPHLPLLHQALLHEPEPPPHAPHDGDGGSGVVGAARLQVATLLAQLAASEVQEVAGTLVALGTPATLLDMFFRFPGNNFLHAQVHALVKGALANAPHRTQYARHLLIECRLPTRLMDAFEANEGKGQGKGEGPRCGYMGYVLLMAAQLFRALERDEELGAVLNSQSDLLLDHWIDFYLDRLEPVLAAHDTPLGGYYPTENIYEFNDMADEAAEGLDGGAQGVEQPHDMNGEHAPHGGQLAEDGGGGAEMDARHAMGCEPIGFDSDEMRAMQQSIFDMMNKNYDSMWDDCGEEEAGAVRARAVALQGDAPPPPPHSLADQVLNDVSPWESASVEAAAACDEGWAQFGSEDPFASSAPAAPPLPAADAALPTDLDREFGLWTLAEGDEAGEASASPRLQADGTGPRPTPSAPGLEHASSEELELANNLLTAMSSMTPEVIAHIVNATVPASDEASDR